MSFLGFEEDATWDAPVQPSSGDIIRDAMKKEKAIKDIIAAQEDLRALLERVKSVESDVDKLTSGNATLQIARITRRLARDQGNQSLVRRPQAQERVPFDVLSSKIIKAGNEGNYVNKRISFVGDTHASSSFSMNRKLRGGRIAERHGGRLFDIEKLTWLLSESI
ncbi:hypothetical protein EW146_g1925 [Bondarzewia mesenterica]|uniref:Uncharacterized protein n=1 Tax=Bondarzewia mesenterica TaxID=1095465 RepID=A0A4S4M267_9AGAM|nr:hypothetical protein EW146_g1925 [Bondarzewia mesenterica]